jgi:hypothetical protein
LSPSLILPFSSKRANVQREKSASAFRKNSTALGD